MSSIQEEFNSRAGDFQMTPGEYEGPLTINRPCVVDGGQSTLWAKTGPVLIVEAEPVTIKNLRIEVTGRPENEETAIAVRTRYAHTVLSGVEVSGRLEGFAHEAASWELPPVIALGKFAAGVENTFALEIDAPAPAALRCTMKDTVLMPDRLVCGKNKIILKTSGMKENTILYGEILVITGVTRRIYVSGKAQAGAPEHHEQPVVAPVVCPVSQTMPVEPPLEIVAPITDDVQVEHIRRGQRMPVGNLQNKIIKLVYDHQSASQSLEIDSYVFLLGADGRTHSDSDLIFFGNPRSEKGDVWGNSDRVRPMVFVDLKKTDAWVNKIAVCFSLYGDDSGQNFSLANEPMLRVFDGEKECYRFVFSDLDREKTVVALEIYRYKGEWKFNFVGAGYHSGLKQLCESYGVEVE